MDAVRFGLSIRALRRHHGWTQQELGAKCGLTQGAISKIERGLADHFTVQALARVVAALGARISVRVLYQGEALDRLPDTDHAAIVERIVQYLRARGWDVVPEATFSIYGERGSIDILAFHPATGALLVIEVKSVVPDVQATLAGIDRKARLAQQVARERGWQVTSVSRWLVLPGDTTSRRRIERHEATFRAALPGRTVAMQRWSAAPSGPVAGIVFVAPSTQQTGRHRLRASEPQNTAT